MLTKIEIYQQPAAFVDTVILSWMIESMSKRHPMSIHQRDMMSAGLSTDALQMSWLAHNLPVYIAGKMTAVLQLTDTDV